MKKIYYFQKFFFLFYLISTVGESLGKTLADVKCNGTEEKLVYDCLISLIEMKTKKNVDSAIFVVGAEMPSMPGAHNVKPIKAHPMGMGMYHVRLNLEMYGEWALRMDFTRPRRDRIVKKMIFGKNGHGMSDDHGGKHKHKDKSMKKTKGHDAQHKDKGMPMKHVHKN